MRATLHDFKADFAKAWSLSDLSSSAQPSPRAEALLALFNKWVCKEAQPDAGIESLAHTLQKQVLVTELKADVAQYRSTVLESNGRASVAQKLRHNMELLDENTSLRREKKLLRDELLAANGTIEELRAALLASMGEEGAGGTTPRAATLSGQVSIGRPGSGRLETIQEDGQPAGPSGSVGRISDAGDESITSYFASLGSRATPSRPVSGASSSISRPTSGDKHQRHAPALPSRSRPHSAAAIVGGGSAGSSVSRPLRPRPHSSHAGGKSAQSRHGVRGAIAHFSPARVLNQLVSQERGRMGELEAAVLARDATIESQRAQMRLLQSMVHQELLEEEEDDNGIQDEMVYEGEADASLASAEPGPQAGEAPSSVGQGDTAESSAGSGYRAQQQRPWIASDARPRSGGAAQGRDAGTASGHVGIRQGLAGSRRPTSAGGANMHVARRALL
jgi:hypothetical protein